ncbi:hypothetical protein [Thalassobaculum sp.]|uniref:hypothetical protein n=1 Tax=Thalassobaculum sp. TaxID=2022740 RepID=UPI003B5A8744
MKRILVFGGFLGVVLILGYNFLTVFVVQPIGAVPTGRTVIISRMNKTNFIDSADAMCARELGGVTLICRGMMNAAIATKATIFLRLPFSQTLYDISTDGKRYDR